MKKPIKVLFVVSVLALSMSLTGCVQPYDVPEFVTVEPNETAFVIPLEGQTSDQGKFDSEEFLAKNMVASKRIQIPHKWIQEGRMSSTGKYVNTIMVLKVDRSPETRVWTNDGTGTAGDATKKEGVAAESRDSIKFSVGVSMTVSITPEDTPRFLYSYKGKALKDIMDLEARNYIESKLNEIFSKYTMDEIKAKKAEIMDTIREDVTANFKAKGMTVVNLGYKGDLTYTNPAVQEAIDNKFKAEQDKVAQSTRNQTMIDKAKAEAEAVRIQASTINEQIRLKELDNEAKLIDQLPNIKFPAVMGGTSGNIMNLPAEMLK